jgi:hypothetical protein
MMLRMLYYIYVFLDFGTPSCSIPKKKKKKKNLKLDLFPPSEGEESAASS